MVGKVAFVLGSFDHAPMIVNRLDYLRGDSGDFIGVGIGLLEKGATDPYDIEFLMTLVNARRQHNKSTSADDRTYVVVDVGANIGTHTVAWARAMEGWGCVLAIEAQERIFYALCGNIALNNCFNARAFWAVACNSRISQQIPVLDHRRPANFGGLSLRNYIKQNPGQKVNFSATVNVAGIRLDDLGLDRCDLIKIDVEGMEGEVLDGARNTVERCRPIVYAEHATCGKTTIIDRLPGYHFQEAGPNVLAMHESDPLWSKLQIINKGDEK
jgi:FkbM family methyltransferase